MENAENKPKFVIDSEPIKIVDEKSLCLDRSISQKYILLGETKPYFTNDVKII